MSMETHLVVRVTGLYRHHWTACGRVIDRDADKGTALTWERDAATCPECLGAAECEACESCPCVCPARCARCGELFCDTHRNPD